MSTVFTDINDGYRFNCINFMSALFLYDVLADNLCKLTRMFRCLLEKGRRFNFLTFVG